MILVKAPGFPPYILSYYSYGSAACLAEIIKDVGLLNAILAVNAYQRVALR